jgi:hypothetical protein
MLRIHTGTCPSFINRKSYCNVKWFVRVPLKKGVAWQAVEGYSCGIGRCQLERKKIVYAQMAVASGEEKALCQRMSGN